MKNIISIIIFFIATLAIFSQDDCINYSGIGSIDEAIVKYTTSTFTLNTTLNKDCDFAGGYTPVFFIEIGDQILDKVSFELHRVAEVNKYKKQSFNIDLSRIQIAGQPIEQYLIRSSKDTLIGYFSAYYDEYIGGRLKKTFLNTSQTFSITIKGQCQDTVDALIDHIYLLRDVIHSLEQKYSILEYQYDSMETKYLDSIYVLNEKITELELGCPDTLIFIKSDITSVSEMEVLLADVDIITSNNDIIEVNTNTDTEVYIFNILGQNLIHDLFKRGINYLDISALKNGMYILYVCQYIGTEKHCDLYKFIK